MRKRNLAVLVSVFFFPVAYASAQTPEREESIVLVGPANENADQSTDASAEMVAQRVETPVEAEPETKADTNTERAEPTEGEDPALEEPEPPAPTDSGGDPADEIPKLDVPEGVEPLLRGPVHEAFAEPLQLNVEESAVVARQPPEPIEELPPEIDQDSDAVWIPGYWAWDDDRNDFIWVSGVWRKAPKGRSWIPGQWVQVDGGVQWIAGYWTKVDAAEQVQVLPAPPATLEQGPTVPQPSANHFWIPGSWQYQNSRYAWRPGFWSLCHNNWVWIPEHYHWHPNGCIHVAGYWDYHWNNRGTLFAPTYFANNVYGVAGFSYTPSVVVTLGSAFDHLWIRPGYNHYFIGDYYTNYAQRGFIPWYSYATQTRYYDPLFAYQRWALRSSVHDLHHYYHQRHDHFHQHANDRPYRTYRDYYNHQYHNRSRTTALPGTAGAVSPARLTGSAFVARVDEIVRQQHRDRHNNIHGPQGAVTRAGHNPQGAANRSTRNNAANRSQVNVIRNNANNVAGTSSSGVRQLTKPGTRATSPSNRLPASKRPTANVNPAVVNKIRQQPRTVGNNKSATPANASTVIRSNTRVPDNNVVRQSTPRTTQPRNSSNRQQSVVSNRVTNPRTNAATTTSPRTLPQLTKPGQRPNSTVRNSNVTSPFIRQNSNRSTTRQNVARPTVTRPNITQPNVPRPNVAQPVSPNRAQTNSNRTAQPRTNAPTVNRTYTRNNNGVNSQLFQNNAARNSIRSTTPNRTQTFRQTSPPVNRSQAFTQRQQIQPQRTQTYRPSTISQPQRTQSSMRNVQPNFRSTPQRSFTPRTVTPQRSFQSRSPAAVRSAPRSSPSRSSFPGRLSKPGQR
ncbi:MAG: YXWGXW repeat-containing protein [Planctomycetales bacterium]|nr:YXWGXW repeat-containing protein [Planctomycetales bacterium]